MCVKCGSNLGQALARLPPAFSLFLQLICLLIMLRGRRFHVVLHLPCFSPFPLFDVFLRAKREYNVSAVLTCGRTSRALILPSPLPPLLLSSSLSLLHIIASNKGHTLCLFSPQLNRRTWLQLSQLPPVTPHSSWHAVNHPMAVRQRPFLGPQLLMEM